MLRVQGRARAVIVLPFGATVATRIESHGTAGHRIFQESASRALNMPQGAIDNFNHALQAWGGKYESEIYDGAQHGWTVVDSPAYNAPQAERAFKALKRLFAETLLGAR